MSAYKPQTKTHEWGTPLSVFKPLDDEFHFTLDVAASDENHKCPAYFTKETDGLTQDWGKNICWMNPPYGLAIRQWVKKAYEASRFGATVVMLVPSTTETQWFQDYVWDGQLHRPRAGVELRFPRGRIKFENPKLGGSSATNGSCIIVFRPYYKRH